MFLDNGLLEEVMKTTTPALLPLPTSTSSASSTSHTGVAPIPTIHPGPSYDFETRSVVGDRTLWVVFVGMFISTLIFSILAWRQTTSKRLFHVLTTFITAFATLSYFAMAVGQGVSFSTDHYKEHHKHGIPATHTSSSREVYWARYVDWSVTTPLLLLDLAFLAGLNGADIVVAIVADLIMVLTGLFGALTNDNKPVAYAWWAMGTAAYLVIVYLIAINGRAVVKTKDNKTASFFTSIAGYTLLLWTAYPVIWILSEGERTLSVDGEIIAYAVLDVLAKPIFGGWLLVVHDRMASSTISVGGFWTRGLETEGGIRVGDDEDGA